MWMFDLSEYWLDGRNPQLSCWKSLVNMSAGCGGPDSPRHQKSELQTVNLHSAPLLLAAVLVCTAWAGCRLVRGAAAY